MAPADILASFCVSVSVCVCVLEASVPPGAGLRVIMRSLVIAKIREEGDFC
jgi:hypothetical protein